MIRNALSIDVEEYYHGVEFGAALSADEYASLPSRVEGSMEHILELLEQSATRATFFTVGQVAESHPHMVRRVAELGHEIACHSYQHELVWRQSPDVFRADVRRAKAVLEDLSGQAVIGYRAPNYSIMAAQDWAYPILGEEGFAYDSSVYPIVHDRYGAPDAPRFPHTIWQGEQDDHPGLDDIGNNKKLLEFPIGTTRVLNTNLPIGGGGYFRLFPVSWTCRGIRRVNRTEEQPVMFYFHPWELDPDHPRPSMPWYHRFRHYVGIPRQVQKLSVLLQALPFSPVRDILGLDGAHVSS